MAHELGCSHHFLTEEISNEEFLGWREYFRMSPPGWREDMRTYYLMSVSGMSKMKQKPEDIFPAIKQMKENQPELTSEEQQSKTVRSFKASPFGIKFAEAMKPGGSDAV